LICPDGGSRRALGLERGQKSRENARPGVGAGSTAKKRPARREGSSLNLPPQIAGCAGLPSQEGHGEREPVPSVSFGYASIDAKARIAALNQEKKL